MVLARWLVGFVGFCFLQKSLSAQPVAQLRPSRSSAEVVVVGAGIAGLSAALELGRGGAQVVVIDMASVFGGHAVMAQGLLNIVGTRYQALHGIQDSPDLAFRDYVNWGEDVNREWVRYYVDHSKEEVFDWLTKLGVTFDGLASPPGNSVPRAHQVRGRGVALVAPIYREGLRTAGVSFWWNVRLDRLLRSAERVTGVELTDVRTGQVVTIEAKAVVLATGGFESNLALVREVWSKGVPFPPRLLAGAGINAMGSGLEAARTSGALIERMDHQWNYLSGLPDPRFPGTDRGLFAIVPSVWVNLEGKRFMAEDLSPKYGMDILLRQTKASFWAVFGPEALQSFYVSGTDWADYTRVEKLILNNPAIVKRAQNLDALASQMDVPADQLRETIRNFNTMVAKGVDEQYARFGPGKAPAPQPISGPPFFAAQFFPITRKSMGGVAINLSCEVLDSQRRPIPGLYAAGEVTGLAGINGKAGLEGTFLAPSLLTGRVAGRTVLALLGKKPVPPALNFEPLGWRIARPAKENNETCLSCHALATQITEARPGFWHFEKVHKVVLERSFACITCHAELTVPYVAASGTHRIDPARQLQICTTCHQGEQP